MSMLFLNQILTLKKLKTCAALLSRMVEEATRCLSVPWAVVAVELVLNMNTSCENIVCCLYHVHREKQRGPKGQSQCVWCSLEA